MNRKRWIPFLFLALLALAALLFPAEVREWLHSNRVIAVLAVVILVALNIHFRHQVKKRTAELSAKNAQLEAEMAERQKVREALARSEAYYRSLIENAQDLVVIVDAEGIIKYASPSCTGVIGFSPDDLIGSLCWDRVHADDRDFVRDKAAQLFANPRSVMSTELRMRHRDGSWRVLHAIASKPDSGLLPGIVLNLRDISDRRAAEEALRASEMRLRMQNDALVALATSDAFSRGDLDRLARELTETASRTICVDRASVWLHDSGEGMLKCIDLFERAGGTHTAGALLHQTDYPRYFETIRRQLIIDAEDATTDIRTREFTDSYLRPNRIRAMLDTPIRVGGKLAGILCLEHCGTTRRWTLEEKHFASSLSSLVALAHEDQRRRQAEERLRESEERMRVVVDYALDAVILMDEKAVITGWNPQAEIIFGLRPDEAAGRMLCEVILPARLRETYREDLDRFLSSGESQLINERVEMVGVRKDGREFPMELAISPARVGNRVHLNAFIRDITELREAQEEIRSLARFPDENRDPVMRIREDGTVLYANRASQPILEMWRRETGRTLNQCCLDHVRRVRSTGESFEMECSSNNRTTSLVFAPVEGADYINVYGRDITDRKQAEIALKESEERFRTLVQHAPEAIVVIDADDQVIIDVNDNAASLFGIARTELIGLGPRDLSPRVSDVGSGDRDILRTMVARALAGETPAFEWSFQNATTGERIPCEMRMVRLPAMGQRLVRASIIDISERKRAEEEREKLVALIENSNDFVGMESLDGQPLFMNRAGRRMLGFETVEAALAGNFQENQPPETIRRIREEAFPAVRRQGLWEGQIQVRNARTGGLIDVQATLFEVRHHHTGKPICYAYVFRDITDRKRAEEAEREREAAEAANRAKSAFLANMSHELRTPMNAILGYSEMLQEEAEDRGLEDFVPDLQKIHGAGKHLLALINDVLDLSKIEAGRMDVYPEDFPLGSLVDEVVVMVQPLVEKNRNTLEVHRPDELGDVHTDQTKVRQILFNLLSNAAKFTSEGRIQLDVARETLEGREVFRMRVADTGIGMSEKQMARLFQEFSQGDPSTTRKYGGTGLGLAISERFCKMMEGQITVTSREGEGSTFEVHLPTRLTISRDRRKGRAAETGGDARAAGDDAITPAPGAGDGPGDALGDVQSRSLGRVLIIDDDPAARELMTRFLAREGYEVFPAASGEEGLRMARETRPAVITLDVIMPGMDGWEVLQQLKQDPALRTIPVIMLTMMNDKERGYTLGASEYLTKPIDRRVLLDSLRRYRGTNGNTPVLVVEDDEDIRDLIRQTLEEDRWRVDVAGNGREALDQIRRRRPALILLDLMMPVMDGFELLMALSRDPDWRRIPVIVLTAMELSPQDRQRLNGDVERVLRKGAYERDELLEEVRRLVDSFCRQPVEG